MDATCFTTSVSQAFPAKACLKFHSGFPPQPDTALSLPAITQGVEMDLQTQLEDIRRTKKKARRRPYRVSRLDRHRAEIEKLRSLGASLEYIRLWLRRYRRIRITRRAILYRLRRWEEERV